MGTVKYFLGFVMFLASCSTPTKITVGEIRVETGNQVGGTAETVIKKGEVVVYHKVDNQESFRQANSSIKTGFAVWGLTDVAKTLSGTYSEVTKVKQGASVEKMGLQEATKQKSLEETTKQAAIEAVPVE